ncbi:MAG: amino acid ABC transporter substrate-binding protein, partial [Betaproteobacteria bacterium]|nr:amino acid ABC transporter substrate-binding protein [Betaproteobacteria bacterium]
MHMNLSKLSTLAAAVAAVATLSATPAHAGKTIDAIKARGQVICGVNPSLPGFAAADSQGNWTGFDIDICKAITATLLSDVTKVKWTPLNASQRFAALQSGEIDVLSRNTTWTLTRDASLGLNFTGVTYYDGQGFMVTKKSKITTAKQLKGATVCVQSGTTTEKNLADYSKAMNLNMKPVVLRPKKPPTRPTLPG